MYDLHDTEYQKSAKEYPPEILSCIRCFHEAMRRYVRDDVMQHYAEGFGKGLNKEDIEYYGKIHFERIMVSAEAVGLGKPMEAVIDKIETFMGQTLVTVILHGDSEGH